MPAKASGIWPYAPAAGSIGTLAQSARRCYALRTERVQENVMLSPRGRGLE